MVKFSLKFHAFYLRSHTRFLKRAMQGKPARRAANRFLRITVIAIASAIEFIRAFVDASCSPWPTRFAGTT